MIQTRWPFLVRQHPFSSYEKFAQTPAEAEMSLGGVRPVDAERVHTWKQHLPRIAFQLQKYPQMTSSLIGAGYEEDDRWQLCLSGVEPLPQQFGEVARPPWKRWETNLRYYLKTRKYLSRRRAEKNRQEIS